MSRVLITGSAQGLGLLAARQLIERGHEVVLHGRNPARARDARGAAPGAAGVVVGDLGSIEQTRQVAAQANASGRFDAVIHNAGVYRERARVETVDGLAHVFAVNVLAPYLLTALIERVKRRRRTARQSASGERGRRVQSVSWQQRRAARLEALGFADLGGYLQRRYLEQGWSSKRMRPSLGLAAAGW
jgi:NAD(P)-dependent dehydrogenase (short-subunit alcohol dehydrogenase family)